jgi:hypothetical protein
MFLRVKMIYILRACSKSENEHLKLLINNNVTKDVSNLCLNRFIFRYLKLM